MLVNFHIISKLYIYIYIYIFFKKKKKKIKKKKKKNFFLINFLLLICKNRWRSSCLSTDEANSLSFIDGDIIESFLELDRDTMQKIANGDNGGTPLGYTVDELVALVEKLKIM